MKNLLALFTLILLFSCGKDNDDDNQNWLLEFPQKYVLSDFDYWDTQFYEMDGSNYSEIAIAGSFIKADMYNEMQLYSEQVSFLPFEQIELIDEENVQIVLTDDTYGNTFDTTLTYNITSDNQVQIIYDGFPFFALDMIPDN